MSLHPKLLRAVLKRDKFRCQYCGRDAAHHGEEMHVDHIFPKTTGGTDDPSNLRTLCSTCNMAKAAEIPDEHEIDLERGPVAPRHPLVGRFFLNANEERETSGRVLAVCGEFLLCETPRGEVLVAINSLLGAVFFRHRREWAEAIADHRVSHQDRPPKKFDREYHLSLMGYPQDKEVG